MGRSKGLFVTFAEEDRIYFDELKTHFSTDIMSSAQLFWSRAPEQAEVFLVLESPALHKHPEKIDLLTNIQRVGSNLLPVALREVAVSLPQLLGLQRVPAIGVIASGPRASREATALRDEYWVEVVRAVLRTVSSLGSTQPFVRRRSEPDARILLIIYPGNGIIRYLWKKNGKLEEIGSSPYEEEPTEDLFHCIFPDEREWRRVFQKLFGAKSAAAISPLNKPVRLQIWQSEERFDRTPIEQLKWGRYLLAEYGWTFERCPRGMAENIAEWNVPGRSLVLSPDEIAPAEKAAIVEAFSDVLPRPTEGVLLNLFFRNARNGDELHAILAELSPELVIMLSGSIKWGDILAQSLSGIPKLPYIAYVEHGSAWHNRQNLLPHVAVLIEGNGKRELTLRWIRIMHRGVEPVMAIYKAVREANNLWQYFPTCYVAQEVRVKATSSQRLAGIPWLKLDRDRQRAMARRHIDELLRAQRRVEAIVVCAEEGNLLEHFLEQVFDELPTGIQYRCYKISNDDSLEFLDQISIALCGTTAISMSKALRSAAPPYIEQRSVVVLDLGILLSASLTPEKLKAWLKSCRELANLEDWPDGVRVLAFLGISVAAFQQKKILDWLHKLGIALTSLYFRTTRLDALGAIEDQDLLNFLFDKEHCNCPSGHEHEAQHLIMDRTAGHYEKTVEILQRAMDGVGWFRVMEELRIPISDPQLEPFSSEF